jgi:hypothetical protein
MKKFDIDMLKANLDTPASCAAPARGRSWHQMTMGK